MCHVIARTNVTRAGAAFPPDFTGVDQQERRGPSLARSSTSPAACANGTAYLRHLARRELPADPLTAALEPGPQEPRPVTGVVRGRAGAVRLGRVRGRAANLRSGRCGCGCGPETPVIKRPRDTRRLAAQGLSRQRSSPCAFPSLVKTCSAYWRVSNVATLVPCETGAQPRTIGT